MKIMFWSDYACPYCYIGEARMRKAVAELGMEREVEYEPRAFELDPAASKKVQSDTASRFAAKYRMSLPQAMHQIEHLSYLSRSPKQFFIKNCSEYQSKKYLLNFLLPAALAARSRSYGIPHP